MVGGIYSGMFKSFYEGKEMPADTSQGDGFNTRSETFKTLNWEKLIAIGDGDFANEETNLRERKSDFLC